VRLAGGRSRPPLGLTPRGALLLLVMFALAAAFSAAHAQTGKWPEKPVRIIIASAPGGGGSG